MHREVIHIPDYKQYMPDWENLPQGTKDNAIGAYLTLKWRAYNHVYFDWWKQQPPKTEPYQELKQLLYDVFGRLALHPYTKLVFSALRYKTPVINTKTKTRGRVINVMYRGEEPLYELDTDPRHLWPAKYIQPINEEK